MIKRLLKFLGMQKKTKGASRKKSIQATHPNDIDSSKLTHDSETPFSVETDQKRSKKSKKTSVKKRYTKAQRIKKSTQKTWSIAEFDVVPMAGETRFHDFSLPLEIMHAIADLGFEYCTPIQTETLPKSMAEHDIIGQAQTGTGKTATFLITVLTHILNKNISKTQQAGAPRVLILVPTRELVMQISKEAKDLGKYSNINVVSVFGGIDYQKQKNEITSGPVDVMVATPGRLLDYQRKKVVRLDKLEILVLDEADRMLDMGFIPDVRKIVLSTPAKEKRQTFFFSATLSPEVNHLASQWTKKAVHVEIEPDKVAVDSVEQLIYLTTADEKYNLLYNLMTLNDLKRVIVFANRRDETRKLTDRLKRNGISCAMLSGEVAQKNRIRTLEDFRNGRIRVLVATDVAGRGIHIDEVSHVVNYTLPFEPENYVHRIGRTGRAGATGISISFACEEGSFYIPEIEEFMGCSLECTYPDEKLLKPAPRGTVTKRSQNRRYGKPKSRSHSQQRRYKQSKSDASKH